MMSFGQEINSEAKTETKTCEVPDGFKEPERDNKTAKWAKQMNKFNEGSFPSLEDIKSHVAIDNDSDVKNVYLLKASEQSGNGIYVLCVNGTEMKYSRTGTVIHRNGTNPLSGN